MNTNYDGSKMAEPKGLGQRLRSPETDIARERNPMLPLLINDLSQATTETYELVELLEKQLSDISSPEDSVPSPPENKVTPSFPPALEMLRTTLGRVRSINRNLASLKRRVEI